jgi:hypothetical protein
MTDGLSGVGTVVIAGSENVTVSGLDIDHRKNTSNPPLLVIGRSFLTVFKIRRCL